MLQRFGRYFSSINKIDFNKYVFRATTHIDRNSPDMRGNNMANIAIALAIKGEYNTEFDAYVSKAISHINTNSPDMKGRSMSLIAIALAIKERFECKK